MIEVTSSTSIGDCRSTIEELLKEMILAGLGSTPANTNNAPEVDGNKPVNNQLIVQQIKITDLDGNLRAVYPSKTDLNFEESASILVERE